MTLLITLIIAAITYGTPLLFGTLGEILTEKSGNLNLGVEGIMFMGGALGLGGVYYYEKLSSSPNGFVAILVGIFFAFLAGAIASLIFSFLTITLRANQNVTGLALSIFGTGIGQFIGEYMRVSENGYISVSNMLKGYFQNSPFPKGLQDIPVVGGILFGNSFFFYLAVACAVALYWYLNKTRSGLYLRSVGESPATADAAGINVTRYKYLATVIGGGCERRRRHGLHHDHRGRCVEPRGSFRRRLARRRAGHLLPVASAGRDLGQRALRRADDPLPASGHRVHSHAAL